MGVSGNSEHLSTRVGFLLATRVCANVQAPTPQQPCSKLAPIKERSNTLIWVWMSPCQTKDHVEASFGDPDEQGVAMN